ncbi:hypothetical protein GMSM_19350 [Geomonas sp. Red276]
MKKRLIRIAEIAAIAALAVTALAAAVWAGPPAPPVVNAQVPVTPLGGPEVSALTVAAVAAYGYWKSRR